MRSKKYVTMLIEFALNRMVESKAINLMCDNEKQRTRFMKRAIAMKHIREVIIYDRQGGEKKFLTYYTITKTGIEFLGEEKIDFFGPTFLDKGVSVFYRGEYTPVMKKRMIMMTTALVMASRAGATVEPESFCFQGGDIDDGALELEYEPVSAGEYTVKNYYTEFLTRGVLKALGVYNNESDPADESYIIFRTSAEYKHMVAGASVRGEERDYAWIRLGKWMAEDFTAWSARAQQKKADCDAGTITEAEFAAWLKSS